MKARIKKTPLVLCLALILTSSVVLTQQVAAKDTDTEYITFSEPTLVGGTKLEANTYKLAWEGNGPQVQVSFIKGSKTVVTAPATLVLEKSKYDGAVSLKTMGDSKVLEKITWKKKALVFEQPSS